MLRVQLLSSDSLLRLKGDIHEDLEVIETERGAVAPGTGLIDDQRTTTSLNQSQD